MLDQNDHRSIGARLDLFHFQEEAPGMVFWHPRGFALLRQLEEAVRRQQKRDGFREVRTPQVLREPVWRASGHAASFSEGMFWLEESGLRAALKPVNCPGQIQIFRHGLVSHHDLPVRLAELGIVHRSEPSGTLQGLFRLRQFTQDDGHIFCRESQVESEVARFHRSLREFYALFGFSSEDVALSTRPEVRAGDDASWDRAESMLAAAARAAGLSLRVQPGMGAFYGPKLEFSLSDRFERPWQCGTIQLDLVMPERFDIAYVAEDGSRQRPALLHRAMLGSLERFLGMVLEHHAGALPHWLCPVQAVVAPVAGEHRSAAERCLERLLAVDVRAELDARNATLGRRVRDAHLLGAPYVLVIGERELADASVMVRDQSGTARAVAADAIANEIGELVRFPEPGSVLSGSA